jgi:hypothetical protein
MAAETEEFEMSILKIGKDADGTERLESQDDKAPDAVRDLCHQILDRIPDRGLPELLESLERIREFYDTTAAPVEQPVTIRQTTARLGKRYDRPSFHIEEE